MKALVGPVTAGMLIRAYRTSRDMNQEALAKRLHVTAGFISSVETGKKKLSLKKVLEICKVLKENENFWMSVYFQQEAREAGVKNLRVRIQKSNSKLSFDEYFKFLEDYFKLFNIKDLKRKLIKGDNFKL